VFPRLREALHPHRVHLADVDLRWGVTDDQDAIDACREVIDECRPYFVGLLGERYGTIPAGRSISITADEIVYGALGIKTAPQAFFYFRDPATTAEMAEPEPGAYREPEGSDAAIRLAELKRDIAAEGYAPRAYRARWSPEQRRLTDLSAFGELVYGDLHTSILATLHSETASPPDVERAATDAFIAERTERLVLGGRRDIVDRLTDFALSTDGPRACLLEGPAGAGKSSLMAALAR
jgi:hypothetical protein